MGKLISLTKAAAENMKLSTELTQPATIIAMAKALNKIPMDRITFVQYPGATGGTGIYAGISGGGRYVETGAAIGVRAANGGCQQRFKVNYVVARLTGAVKL